MTVLQQAFFWLLGLSDPGTISGASDWQWYSANPTNTAILVVLTIIGLALALLNFMPKNGMPIRTRFLTSFCRILAFAMIILFFVQLELRVTVNRDQRPNVAILTDYSGSMSETDGGETSRLATSKSFKAELIKKLGSDANITDYHFNWKLRLGDGGEKEPSGMSNIMKSSKILQQKEGDMQALIILTDGNDTSRDSGGTVAPLYTARGIPIYPVVFGSSEERKSVPPPSLTGDPYVRLGDKLHLEATLAVTGFSGKVPGKVKLFQLMKPIPVEEDEDKKDGEKKDGEKKDDKKKEGEEKEPKFKKVPPKLLIEQDVLLGKEPRVVTFEFEPKKAGKHTYEIRLEGIKGLPPEKRIVDTHTVQVIDQKIRVLYIDIPRPERKIVGHWVARDPVIDMAGLLRLPKGGWFAQGQMRHKNKGTGLPDDEADLNEYDVIILGDIARAYFKQDDAVEKKMSWLADFVRRRGGGLITQGGQSVYAAGSYQNSELAKILPFQIKAVKNTQIKGKLKVSPTEIGQSHPIMMLERDASSNRDAWFELPKIEGCNVVGEVKPGAQMLATITKVFDKVGDEGKKQSVVVPAIAYHKIGKGQVLSMSIDTTWRWEMMRKRGEEGEGQAESTDYFRRFWGNAIRHLSPDPLIQPGRPQISRRESRTEVGQTITLATRLVHPNYSPMRKADLTIHVISPSGKHVRIFPSDSESKPGIYEYKVVLTEPGLWQIEAIHKEAKVRAEIAKYEKAVKKAKLEDKDPKDLLKAQYQLKAAKKKIARDEIRAVASQSEFQDVRSKPLAMESFAAATNGKSFTPQDVDKLVEALKFRTHAVSQSYTIPVWNLPAMMILFILLICLDCLIRKRRGLV